MNGTDIELRKELWMWRGVTIILLLMVLMTNVVTFFVDRERHAQDNQERAAAWQRIFDRTETNAKMIKGVRDDLQHCTLCHAHAPEMGTINK